MMKNKIIKISILFVVGFFIATPVFADENDLVVEFENQPLFEEANFLPGNEVERTVTVTNNTSEAQDIIVEAINTSDPDGFGDMLDLTIKEGASELYNNTLSAFFSAGEVSLSTVSGNEGSIEYNFTVSFKEAAGNDYQDKSLGFDILIGFQGGESESSEEGGDGENGGVRGGGGGGGGSPRRGLTILGESVEVTDTMETSVTINWTTSYNSTSQVVYSAEGEPHILDLNDSRFGYTRAYPEPEDFTKVVTHSVTITGLLSGTTYYFRCISHASPHALSQEYSFATLGSEEILMEDEGGIGGIEEEVSPLIGPAAAGPAEGGLIVEPAEGEEESLVEGELPTGEEKEKEQQEEIGLGEEEPARPGFFNNFSAAIIGFGSNLGSWLIILGVILLLLFILILLRKKRKKSVDSDSTKDIIE